MDGTVPCFEMRHCFEDQLKQACRYGVVEGVDILAVTVSVYLEGGRGQGILTGLVIRWTYGLREKTT